MHPNFLTLAAHKFNLDDLKHTYNVKMLIPKADRKAIHELVSLKRLLLSRIGMVEFRMKCSTFTLSFILPLYSLNHELYANILTSGTSSEVSIPAYSSHGYGTIFCSRSFAAHKDRLTHGHHRGRSRRKEGLQPAQAWRH